MKKVLCCPFCGCNWDIRVEALDDEHFQIVCPPCGAAGPMGYSANDALDEWNIRYLLVRAQDACGGRFRDAPETDLEKSDTCKE
jgi:Lar family restriction alleviation protein